MPDIFSSFWKLLTAFLYLFLALRNCCRLLKLFLKMRLALQGSEFLFQGMFYFYLFGGVCSCLSKQSCAISIISLVSFPTASSGWSPVWTYNELCFPNSI